jgi:hypothetical protein
VPASYAQEIEPDDSLNSPMALSGPLPITLFGSLVSVGQSIDEDYYSVELSAGTSVSIVTRPLCGTAATGVETSVILWDTSFNFLAESSFQGGYGDIHQYPITASATYVIQVDAPFSSSGTSSSAYILNISTIPTPVMTSP